jgi:hypothetical protein
VRKYCLYLSILVSGFIFFIFPTLTFAHFPATDGTTTVTLHVDPDDDPIPTKQANLYFLIDDKTKEFELSNCGCIVTITEQGKQIYQGQLLSNTDSTPSIWGEHVPFVFPKRDVYQISLTGKPLMPQAFQPFSVSWNFRVDQYPPAMPLQNPFILFGIVIIIGAVIFVCIRLS